MSIGALDAANAYGRLVRTPLGTPNPGAAKPAAPMAPGGFGSLVQGMVTESSTAMRGAETATAKQLAGKGDLVDVTTALGAAEMALETVVAVRDKVVSAYTDIMRMQI